MAIKSANGKLPYYASLSVGGSDRVMDALRESNFGLLEIDLRHVLAAARLPQHHRDPFDRMMIAQAILEDLTIISNDRTFPRYRGLRLLAA
jgi:PIN domain nuclease of toxin-antitoxin system